MLHEVIKWGPIPIELMSLQEENQRAYYPLPLSPQHGSEDWLCEGFSEETAISQSGGEPSQGTESTSTL